jgi:hypothetical protein
VELEIRAPRNRSLIIGRVRARRLRSRSDGYIVSDVPFVTDYAGKAGKRKKFSSDDILILPRTLQELLQKVAETEDVGGVDRELKDIMSAHNVSEEIAQEIHQAKIRKCGPEAGRAR